MAVKATDGDTINVLDADKVTQKIQLTGIDAPERGQLFAWFYYERFIKVWRIHKSAKKPPTG